MGRRIPWVMSFLSISPSTDKMAARVSPRENSRWTKSMLSWKDLRKTTRFSSKEEEKPSIGTGGVLIPCSFFSCISRTSLSGVSPL